MPARLADARLDALAIAHWSTRLPGQAGAVHSKLCDWRHAARRRSGRT
jgi:hypothetical protein